MDYFAHSENDYGVKHRLAEHLRSVGQLAGSFAENCRWTDEAVLAGLLHDLGKYGDLFQARLRGEEAGLDHWSAGQLIAFKDYRAVAAALAIEGHHIGLQSATTLADRLKQINDGNSPLGHHIRLSEKTAAQLSDRAHGDGIKACKPIDTVLKIEPSAWSRAISRMLDVRMLFSCLVDADYLDTEAHFNGDSNGKRCRPVSPPLHAEKTVGVLAKYMDAAIRGQGRSSQNVDDVRAALWSAVTEAANLPIGTYSLTAPTGSGKTFAMLQFALAHARKHGLKRVVLAVPYLSIIEQTARIYRQVFRDESDVFVLEHHSLAGVGPEQRDANRHDDKERQRRLMSENWDAPIIITTNVQLLESLFSNRPSACRKLHRLRDAVILFDEAQSLPQDLAVPTLAALSHLANAHNSTVVFATATQPAFDCLDEAVQRQSDSGWHPREIIADHSSMFCKLKRVDVEWPAANETLSWSSLKEELSSEANSQVLCVLNLKRHAHALLGMMEGMEELFHLSTNLCTAHRRSVLDEVRRRLDPKTPQPCRLISTQCVEAGVDLDFPLVYRAMAPLEAVAQAAGRCNREGRMNAQGLLGRVKVFEPEADTEKRQRMFPTFSYFQATEVTTSLLRECGGKIDINDPAIYRRYYQSLYDVSRPESQNEKLTNAIQSLDFPEISANYKLIDQDAIQVVVPWRPPYDYYRQLREQWSSGDRRPRVLPRRLYRKLRKQALVGVDGKWMRAAQVLSVSIYRPKSNHPAWGCLVPVHHRRGGESDEWFVLEDPDGRYYDNTLGIQLPQNQQVMIA